MTTDVFNAAVAVARKVGYRNITRQAVSAEMGKSVIWLSNNCKLGDIILQIQAQAEELGVEPGERRVCSFSLWREQDKAHVLNTAYTLAKAIGYGKLSRSKIAKAAGFSEGTVSGYFGTMGALRDALMQMAIDRDEATLILRGKTP